MTKSKTPFLKFGTSELETFDAPASYEFTIKDRIKIETVASFLKRGGIIEKMGKLSDAIEDANQFIDFKKAA